MFTIGVALGFLLASHRAAHADERSLVRTAHEAYAQRHPHDPIAWAALSHARLACGDPEGAEEAASRGLSRRPDSRDARIALVRAHLARHDPPAASRALALDRVDDATSRRLRAEVALGEGRSEAAWHAAAAALRLAPDDADVVATAADAAYRSGRLPRARRLYAAVVRLDPSHEVANLRLGNGFSPRGGRLAFGPGNQRARFDEGADAWRRGDLARARVLFADLVRDEPDNVRYRHAYGLVLREGRRVANRCDEPVAIASREEPPPVPGEGDLVPGFSRLPAWQQAVVRRAIAPMGAHLPALVAAGARHEILSLASSLVDAEERAHLVGQTTPDGRWYAHLRGVGGLHAATGEELLRAAAQHEFDTFAHEFAHQILTHALPAERRGEVNALYRSALEAGACLDDYAASNVDEYFAQGYEAFVSEWKRPGVRHTASHTRAELARRDPALYDLFVRLTSPPAGGR